MKSLSLILEHCPNSLSVIPTNKIGDGADGEVFEIQNNPNLVIKCGVMYEYSSPIFQEIERLEKVAQYLIRQIPSAYVHVHEYKRVNEGSRITVSGNQKYILYYYIMDKCFKISEDEKKVFHSILSHEDRNIKKYYEKSKIISMLKGMAMGLDFDMKKVLDFYLSIQNSGINNTDIHPRNIMKNDIGEFKLIDFDRSFLT